MRGPKSYIRKVVLDMGLPPHCVPDAIWAGWGGFFEAQQKNINPPSIVIKRRIVDFLRQQTYNRNLQPPEFGGDTTAASIKTTKLRQDGIDNVLDLERLMKLAALDAKRVRVIELYRQGYTQPQIGKEIGVNCSRVSQLLADSIEKMRRAA